MSVLKFRYVDFFVGDQHLRGDSLSTVVIFAEVYTAYLLWFVGL